MSRETFEPIGSSNIASVTYDGVSEDLEIEFTDGATYLYRNVPPSIYRGFQSAGSAGQFFHRAVKNRFSYERQ